MVATSSQPWALGRNPVGIGRGHPPWSRLRVYDGGSSFVFQGSAGHLFHPGLLIRSSPQKLKYPVKPASPIQGLFLRYLGSPSVRNVLLFKAVWFPGDTKESNALAPLVGGAVSIWTRPEVFASLDAPATIWQPFWLREPGQTGQPIGNRWHCTCKHRNALRVLESARAKLAKRRFFPGQHWELSYSAAFEPGEKKS